MLSNVPVILPPAFRVKVSRAQLVAAFRQHAFPDAFQHLYVAGVSGWRRCFHGPRLRFPFQVQRERYAALGEGAGDAFAILGELASVVRVAGTGKRNANRRAIHFKVGERQSGHSLRRKIHFRGPFTTVAMQVEDDAQFSSRPLQRALPYSRGIGGCQHGGGHQQPQAGKPERDANGWPLTETVAGRTHSDSSAS
jgi:hypothetical protein